MSGHSHAQRSDLPSALSNSVFHRGLNTDSSQVPEKYRYHRKSSIPFADRSPLVRFIKKPEELSPNELGGHDPDANRASKPILKKTDFPILVDESKIAVQSESSTMLAAFSSQTGTSPIISGKDVNEQMTAATIYVERAGQFFGAAERDARGALDILTFPVITAKPFKPLARFYCGIIVATICIEDLLISTAKKDGSGFKASLATYLTKIQHLVQDLTKAQTEYLVEVKKLLDKMKLRYKQWGKKLIAKGEFRTVERHSVIPVYARKGMPESVTLYETEFPELRSFGRAQFYRTTGGLDVLVDLKGSDSISKAEEEVSPDEGLCLIENLLSHSTKLVEAAKARILKAKEVLDSEAFDDEYPALRKRVGQFEYDPNFDPLVGLELKNALAEVAMRKEEMLNVVEHAFTYGKKMETFLKMFQKYCRTVGEQKRDALCRGLCWRCGRVGCEQMYGFVEEFEKADFMVAIPVAEQFLEGFCHMAPVGSEASFDVPKEGAGQKG